MINTIYATIDSNMLRAPMKFGENDMANRFLDEVKFTMQILGLKEYDRTLGILNNSLDPIAFVNTFVKESGKTEEDVLKVLMQIPALKAKALKYRERKAILEKNLDAEESTCRFLRIDVKGKGSSIAGDSDPQELKPGRLLSDFLAAQYDSAQNTAFAYRDGMDEYVARFLGLCSEKPQECSAQSECAISERNFCSGCKPSNWSAFGLFFQTSDVALFVWGFKSRWTYPPKRSGSYTNNFKLHGNWSI